MSRLHRVFPWIVAAGLLTAACSPAAPPPDLARRPAPPATPCSSDAIDPAAGASAHFCLTAAGGLAPLWSGHTGWIAATSGPMGFSVEGRCVLAFTVSDGHQIWRWSDPRHPVVGGAIAAGAVVVVAAGNTGGTPPAAVFGVTDDLVGLDAATGRELWSRPLPNDGQSIPDVFAGPDIVVSLADGAILGIHPATGSTVWSDRAPASCQTSTAPRPS